MRSRVYVCVCIHTDGIYACSLVRIPNPDCVRVYLGRLIITCSCHNVHMYTCTYVQIDKLKEALHKKETEATRLEERVVHQGER